MSLMGAEVEEIETGLGDEVEHCFLTLWKFKIASQFGGLSDSELSLLEPKVGELIEEGRLLTPVQFGEAMKTRENLWGSLCNVFDNFDLLVTPTTAVTAFDKKEGPPRCIAGREINSLIGWFLTYPFNLTGHPVISLPCPVEPGRMPVGIQVVSRRLDDEKLLSLSSIIEKGFK